MVGIVGSVGCGKSSLLSAILGEMQKIKGTVTINVGHQLTHAARTIAVKNVFCLTEAAGRLDISDKKVVQKVGMSNAVVKLEQSHICTIIFK